MATTDPLVTPDQLPTVNEVADATIGVYQPDPRFRPLREVLKEIDPTFVADPSLPGFDYDNELAQAPSTDGGWLDEFQGLAASGALGATTGVEAAGSVLELAFPDAGEWLRQRGKHGSDWLIQTMPQSYQEALNKSWLDLSSGGAMADPRAWASAAAQQLIYMVPVLGSARLAELGAAGAAKLAGKELAESTARKTGYVTAGAGFGAGEAASGAARAADAADLTDEERLAAMRVAAPFGAAAGAILGPALEHLTGGAGTVAGRLAVGAAGEAVEEAGTQLGTETGKAAVGLEFDPSAIAESAVQGAAIGGPANVLATAPQHAAAAAQQRQLDLARVRAAEADATRKAEVAAMLERLRPGQAALPAPDQPAALLPSKEQAIGGAKARAASFRAQADSLRKQADELPLGSEQRKIITEKIIAAETTADDVERDLANYAPPPPEPDIAPQGPDPDQAVLSIMRGDGSWYAQETADQVGRRRSSLDTLQDQFDRADGPQRKRLAGRLRKAKAEYDQWNSVLGRLQTMLQDIEGTQLELPNIGLDDSQSPPQRFYQHDRALPGNLERTLIPSVVDRLKAQSTAPMMQANTVPQPTPATIEEMENQLKVFDELPLIRRIRQSEQRSLNARRAAQARWAKKEVVVDVSPSPDAAVEPTLNELEPAAQAAVRSGQEAAKLQAAPPPAPRAQLPPVTGTGQFRTAEQAAIAARTIAAGVKRRTTSTLVQEANPTPPEAPAPTAPLQTEGATPAVEAAASPVAAEAPGSPIPQLPPLPQPAFGRDPSSARQAILQRLLSPGVSRVDDYLSDLQRLYGPLNRHTEALVMRLRGAFPKNRSPVVRAAKLDRDYQALYDPSPKSEAIYVDVDQAEDLLTALLHETVHAAAVTKVRNNPAVERQLTDLMEKVAYKWDLAGYMPKSTEERAFEGPEEFLAYALTDSAFADRLDGLMMDKSTSALQRFRRAMRVILGQRQYASEPDTDRVLDRLLEFIPDGEFIDDSDGATRQAVLGELDRLGISEGAALFSLAASTFRRNNVGGPSAAGSRPGQRRLAVMSTDQINESWGKIGQGEIKALGKLHKLRNVIGNYYALMSGRNGYAARKEREATRIFEEFKNFKALAGSEILDGILMDARLWSLHPDKPFSHPDNAYGASLPGALELYNDLARRWHQLGAIGTKKATGQGHAVFKLIRTFATLSRNEQINQMLVGRMRARQAGLGVPHAADLLQRVVDAPGTGNNRVLRETHAGITLEGRLVLSSADLAAFVSSLGLDPKKAATLLQDLKAVYATLGEVKGPYVPQRRYGDWFVTLKSAKQSRTMAKAAFDKLVAENRMKFGGDLQLENVKDLGNGMVSFDSFFHSVSMAQNETKAKQLHAELLADWAKRKITPAPGESNYKRRKDNAFDNAGINSAGLEALKNELIDQMGGPKGSDAHAQQAVDILTRFYLEKLPDTSVAKARMRSRNVAGAESDMLRVFADYAANQAYFASQTRYGHRISRLLGVTLDEDVKALAQGGQANNANDLRAIGDTFAKREQAMAQQMSEVSRAFPSVIKLWQRVPQVAGAWLLTGPGTLLTNMMQPMALTLPFLGAKYGVMRSSRVMAGVMKDVFRPGLMATGREVVGGALPTLKTVAHHLTGGRIRPGRSIKDPHASFFEQLTAGLSTKEKALIGHLADYNKLDFGNIADIRSVGSGEGPGWAAVTAMTEWMFSAAQAVETTNRVVTALASYRLDKPMLDKGLISMRDVVKNAARAIDRTQFNYTSDNRAPIFKTPLLRPAMVFKTYPQNILYNVLHFGLQGFKGGTPGERKFARKFIATWFGATAVAAGGVGFLSLEPFWIVATALMAMFGSDDEDPEDALRRLVADLPDTLAMMLMKGVPYGLGVDTSRMGLGGMIPLQDFRDAATGGDPKDVYTAIGKTVMGVPGSIGLDGVWEGIMAIADGDTAKGLRMMTPKAMGLNDLIRFWEYGTSGVSTGAEHTLVDPKEISTLDRIVRIMGFEPSHIAEARAKHRSALRRKHDIVSERNQLIRDYGEAVLDNDTGAMQRLLADAVEFNDENPYAAITGKTIKRHLQERQVNAAAIKEYGWALKNKADMAIEQELQPLYNN